jgi:hypothetical protein
MCGDQSAWIVRAVGAGFMLSLPKTADLDRAFRFADIPVTIAVTDRASFTRTG